MKPVDKVRELLRKLGVKKTDKYFTTIMGKLVNAAQPHIKLVEGATTFQLIQLSTVKDTLLSTFAILELERRERIISSKRGLDKGKKIL
jgi:hypothetical protein